jgi:TetR/AcrR family transcriptional regulator, transcriptional repressor for nem operon
MGLINFSEIYNMPRIKAFDETTMVEKATNLFQLKGYEATSMQELVDTLGISRSSLYDTFGDKHQLYCKTLHAYCNENVHHLVKQAETAEDPLQFIEHIFNNVIEQSKKDILKKGCYVVNTIVEFSDRNTDVKKIVDENNKAFEKMLEKLILKAQLQKQIAKNKNAKQLARFLFNTIYGIRVSSKANIAIKKLKETAAIALGALQ